MENIIQIIEQSKYVVNKNPVNSQGEDLNLSRKGIWKTARAHRVYRGSGCQRIILIKALESDGVMWIDFKYVANVGIFAHFTLVQWASSSRLSRRKSE